MTFPYALATGPKRIVFRLTAGNVGATVTLSQLVTAKHPETADVAFFVPRVTE